MQKCGQSRLHVQQRVMSLSLSVNLSFNYVPELAYHDHDGTKIHDPTQNLTESITGAKRIHPANRTISSRYAEL